MLINTFVNKTGHHCSLLGSAKYMYGLGNYEHQQNNNIARTVQFYAVLFVHASEFYTFTINSDKKCITGNDNNSNIVGGRAISVIRVDYAHALTWH